VFEGTVVALEIINPDPRYSKVHLIEPAPWGTCAGAGRSWSYSGVLKWQARQLAQLDMVERATVYDALAFTPPGGYVKGRPAPCRSHGSSSS
jgi:hypothetical protein